MNVLVFVGHRKELVEGLKGYILRLLEFFPESERHFYIFSSEESLPVIEKELAEIDRKLEGCFGCNIIVISDEVTPIDRIKELVSNETDSVIVALPHSWVILSRFLNALRESGISMIPETWYMYEPGLLWKGLEYPYIPGSVVLPKKKGFKCKIPCTKGLADKYQNLENLCVLGKGKPRLPPLRCAIAELSRRINVALKAVIPPPTQRLSLDDIKPHEASFRLALSSDYMGEAIDFILPIHDEREFIDALGNLTTEVCRFMDSLWGQLKIHGRLKTHRRNAFRQLIYISGLSMPRIVDCSGPSCGSRVVGRKLEDLAKRSGKSLLVDSNMMYAGVHNIAYKGIEVFVPYCIFYEVSAIYSESAKAQEYGDVFIDLAAYMGLEELLISGSGELVSSHMAHKCEAVLPMMDPFLLSKSIIVTRDIGAYRLWKIHPMLAGTDIVLVDSPSCDEMAIRVRDLSYDEAMYYFLQLVVLLRLLTRGKYHKENMRFLQVDFEAAGEKVYVPYPKISLYK
ncbi:MAG: hypothetical protein GSR77_06690 [Desulfurococcales archaeon]|nr:hypothetical protein [Desulfurococcales archaeon]